MEVEKAAIEQKIATHQLTQVKTMIRKNYNTKYSIL